MEQHMRQHLLLPVNSTGAYSTAARGRLKAVRQRLRAATEKDNQQMTWFVDEHH